MIAEDLAGSRIAITGSTGFVGANLTRLLLEQGYQVRSLVRPSSNLANLDGLDVEIVNTHPRDRNVIVTLRFVATGATTGLIKSKVVVTAEGQEQSADVIVRVGAPS